MRHYLSLIKFSHTVFALPFAIIGYFIAVYFHHYPFEAKIFLLVILCMVFARSAAMAFNRYLDSDIDRKNPRTAIREIPKGIISKNQSLIFVFINSLLFIISTFFINKICFFLSPVALLVILGYSFTKRFTFLCHIILGVGLSLAPIGAYLAVTGEFALLPILFSFAVLFWVSGFDIIYALQDEDFDKEQKLFSIPAFFGKKTALQVSNVLHLFSSLCIIIAGIYADFGIWYWAGAIIFLSLLIYQHTLVKPDNLNKVNLAFFTTNGIASIVFAVFVILELLTG